MTRELRAATRSLTVSTPLGQDVLLLDGFSGTEAISELFSFELDMFASNDTAVPFDQLLGQPITVGLALKGQQVRYFSGICSRFSEGARTDRKTLYRAEVVPQLWLLTKRRQSRIFQQLSVPDVLNRVLANLNVSFQLQGNFEPRNYCVQYRETDFDFASRLMEEEGIFYFFKHATDGSQMIFADGKQGYLDLPGGKLSADYGPEGTAFQEHVRSWEKSQQICAGKAVVRDHHFELPAQNLQAEKTVAASVSAGPASHSLNLGNHGLENYDFPGRYAKRFDGVGPGGSEQPSQLQKIFTEATRTADLHAQELAASALTIAGEGTCLNLGAGYKFTLQGDAKADGDYLITRVQHSVSQAFTSGAKLQVSNKFECVPLDVAPRPRRVTPRPHCGLQTAKVVGPAGETIFVDKYGRVKVQFFWDLEGQSDQGSSGWVRVGQIATGKQKGAIFVPQVGEEVLVDFLDGDPDQPIIVGRVYNAENMPPFALPANKTWQGMVLTGRLEIKVGEHGLLTFEPNGDVTLTGTDVQVH
jgi:type VI secretion system secreted protein VgrG